jgi:adenylate cyclase, class 2
VQNVELKARYPDLDKGRRAAEALGAEHVGVERQVDTYFACPAGRLKLRESTRTGATLIWYERPDQPDAKTSHYLLADATDATTMRALLGRALGERLVVDKQRDLYLWRNVRIHLDDVQGLGRFLEFEAVLGPDDSIANGQHQVAELIKTFGVRPEDQLDGSYSDLLAEASARR